MDDYSPKARVKIIIKNSRGKVVKRIYVGWRSTNVLRHYSYRVRLARGKYGFYVYARDKAGNAQQNVAVNRLDVD